MNGFDFDEQGTCFRRVIVVTLALLALLALGLGLGTYGPNLFFGPSSATAAELAEPKPQLMFVQMSEDLSVDTAKHKLRLVKVSPQTLYFSDRPVRLAGHIKMADYLETWKTGKDNFGEDPPNASLSVYQPGQVENTVVIVELLNPVFDGSDLVYDYKLIEGTMPSKGGATSLFIDWVVVRGGGVGYGTRGRVVVY